MPISPDSDYCIDGLIACLELTPDLGIAARVGRVDVDALVDQNEHPLVTEIERRVLAWWETDALPEQRGFCSMLGLCTLSASLRELLWGVTGPLAEQYLISRGAVPGRDIFGVELPPQTIPVDLPNIQALRQPIIIQTMIAAVPLHVRYIGLMRNQYRRAVRALHDCPIGRVIDWSASSSGRQLLGRSTEPKIPRRIQKQRRKALRRSLRSFDQIVGRDAYQAFISNDGFMIKGHLFDYHVRKKYDLLDSVRLPIVPYFLNIHEKGDTANSLGSGCVYFENTPILDQVIALTLHVQDREAELDLLKISNWTFTDSGKKHDVFQKLAAKPPVPEPVLVEAVEPAPSELTTADRIFYDVSRNGRSMRQYRKRIMDCIEPDAMRVISTLTNIPLPLYQWISGQDQFGPSLTNFVTNPMVHECLEQSAELEFQQ
jgi:hypothetical protein